MVRQLLRSHFARAALEAYPALVRCQYIPGNRSTGGENTVNSLRVDLADTWNPSLAESYPAILIRGGDLGNTKLGIDDRHMAPGSGHKQGTRYYTTPYAGSVLVFCLSRLPSQAHLLALESAEHLQRFSSDIRKRGNLAAFRVSKVGSPKPLREQPQILASPVIIEYGLFESWSVTPVRPIISRFETSVTTR